MKTRVGSLTAEGILGTFAQGEGLSDRAFYNNGMC